MRRDESSTNSLPGLTILENIRSTGLCSESVIVSCDPRRSAVGGSIDLTTIEDEPSVACSNTAKGLQVVQQHALLIGGPMAIRRIVLVGVEGLLVCAVAFAKALIVSTTSNAKRRLFRNEFVMMMSPG